MFLRNTEQYKWMEAHMTHVQPRVSLQRWALLVFWRVAATVGNFIYAGLGSLAISAALSWRVLQVPRSRNLHFVLDFVKAPESFGFHQRNLLYLWADRRWSVLGLWHLLILKLLDFGVMVLANLGSLSCHQLYLNHHRSHLQRSMKK